MIQFHYHPTSTVSRRVLVALLEKRLDFETIVVSLGSDQLVAGDLNPWHQIPVLVDDGFAIFESMAILEYLDAKYPDPVLLPSLDPESSAIARMVAMVTDNKLYAANSPQWRKVLGLSLSPQTLERSQQQIRRILTFFESKLGESTYFFSDQLTLPDLVAGTAVPSLPVLGSPLDDYPRLKRWSEALSQRESWQKTTLSLETIEQFKPELINFCEKRYSQ